MSSFIPKVFDEHLETVGLLWARRKRALRSADYTGAQLAELDDLIDAHIEGLVAAGEDATPILEGLLRGDDPFGAFAAASALLRVGTAEVLQAIVEVLTSAKAKKLEALGAALSYGPSTSLRPQLVELFGGAAPNVAVAAGVVLAFHGGFSPAPGDVERLLRADEPATRASGWRLVTYCKTPIDAGLVERAIHDDDVELCGAAIEAAAWNASPAFYPYCRELAERPTPESIDPLVLLAAVAPPQAYQLIEAVGSNPAAGADRFRIVGAFGHPYFIEFLVRYMEQGEPTAAKAAAIAFEKMTGRSVPAKRPPPAGAGKSGDEAPRPDAELARKYWFELAPRLAQSPRICRGFDVSRPLDRAAFAELDRESAWELCLRARLTAGWDGTPLTLERFPQRV